MRFQIGKKELLEALKSVQPAVAKRSTLPILGGIKLEAADGKLSLEATDLEFAIRLSASSPTGPGTHSIRWHRSLPTSTTNGRCSAA